MNQAAKQYWNNFWQDKTKPEAVSAWQFGAEADTLAALVIAGTKTATCSAYELYALENEAIPQVDEYSIILNSKDQPVAIIKTTEVTITPMNEVSEEFAIAEGEGDRTYEYWWNVHVDFFEKELEAVGREFSEDMLLVCERFELVHVK